MIIIKNNYINIHVYKLNECYYKIRIYLHVKNANY